MRHCMLEFLRTQPFKRWKLIAPFYIEFITVTSSARHPPQSCIMIMAFSCIVNIMYFYQTFIIVDSLASKISILNPGLIAVSGMDDSNLTKAQIELSGLSITLLLEDPLGDGKNENGASQDHVLCEMADRFFYCMSSTAFGSKDLEEIQGKFNDACLHSHLR